MPSEDSGQSAERLIGSVEILDLLNLGTSAQTRKLTDQLEVVEIAGRQQTLYADSDSIEEVIKGPRKRMPKLFDKPD